MPNAQVLGIQSSPRYQVHKIQKQKWKSSPSSKEYCYKNIELTKFKSKNVNNKKLTKFKSKRVKNTELTKFKSKNVNSEELAKFKRILLYVKNIELTKFKGSCWVVTTSSTGSLLPWLKIVIMIIISQK